MYTREEHLGGRDAGGKRESAVLSCADPTVETFRTLGESLVAIAKEGADSFFEEGESTQGAWQIIKRRIEKTGKSGQDRDNRTFG